MRIRWTPAAAADLEDIGNYLKTRHPHYLKEQDIEVLRIYHAAQDRP